MLMDFFERMSVSDADSKYQEENGKGDRPGNWFEAFHYRANTPFSYTSTVELAGSIVPSPIRVISGKPPLLI